MFWGDFMMNKASFESECGHFGLLIFKLIKTRGFYFVTSFILILACVLTFHPRSLKLTYSSCFLHGWPPLFAGLRSETKQQSVRSDTRYWSTSQTINMLTHFSSLQFNSFKGSLRLFSLIETKRCGTSCETFIKLSDQLQTDNRSKGCKKYVKASSPTGDGKQLTSLNQ